MTAPRHRKPCAVEGCTSKVHVHGMCQSHARRQRLYGEPTGTEDMREVVRLRRMLGLPPAGPTTVMVRRWRRQEELNDVGWLS